jgi:hypothetical protein
MARSAKSVRHIGCRAAATKFSQNLELSPGELRYCRRGQNMPQETRMAVQLQR